MKKLIILFLLTTIVNSGQTVYKVEPGSKGNSIVLEIENVSNEQIIDGITITVSKQVSSLHFKKTEQKIDHLSQNREIEFVFDVEREVSSSRIDTLKFILTGSNGIKEEKEILIGYTMPQEYKLAQNYPNPFNPTTKIEYQLPKDGRVTIKVFNILGQEVRTLLDEVKMAGYFSLELNAQGLSSGIYIYGMITGEYRSFKKMILLK